MKKLIFLISAILAINTPDVGFANSKSKIQTHKKPSHNTISIPSIYGKTNLADELNDIINNNGYNLDIAVYVKSMQNNEDIYKRNINQKLTPASTLKIFTAETALIYLGPEYRFSTELLTDAKVIKEGELQGNLYITLSGDPTLNYYDLIELFQTLRAKQIKAIAGNIYIDNSAYDEKVYGPGWDPKDRKFCYSAPISASIINHNCLSFQMAPSKWQNHAAQLLMSPKYFYPPIQNKVITRSARTRACYVHLSQANGANFSVEGCIPKRNIIWGASYVITNVNDYEYILFKKLVSRMNIKVKGKLAFGKAPAQREMLGQHYSKPLRLLINRMLKNSDNIIAGALFKKIGQLYNHQPGSWENSRFAVNQILAHYAKVDTTDLRVLDGSGLSADNEVTPAQMMQVLNYAYHHYTTSYEFVSALPIAGVDGTLKHRMWNIARKVRAKTGTISGVASLAGYAVGKDKEPYAFVIMINGHKGLGWQYRALEDKIATAITRFSR